MGGDPGTIIDFSLEFTNFAGGCLSPASDDGIPCTHDSCDPATGETTNEASADKCDDEVDCTDNVCLTNGGE